MIQEIKMLTCRYTDICGRDIEDVVNGIISRIKM